MAAAVLVPAAGQVRSAPPGVDPDRWRWALVEDTLDLVSALRSVRPVAVVVDPTDVEAVAALTWPGTKVLPLPSGTPADQLAAAALDALAGLGAELGAVLAADCPDLPGMLVGKLFSALEDAPVSVSPARDGGFCGVAARLPVPDWARAAPLDLDAVDGLARLHAAAPRKAVVVGPGWHRLREPLHIRYLDANLEGWDAVRAVLSVH